MKRVKRQASEQKIFVSVSDKGLVSRIYKEIFKINEKLLLKEKWARDLNKHFTKEYRHVPLNKRDTF